MDFETFWAVIGIINFVLLLLFFYRLQAMQRLLSAQLETQIAILEAMPAEARDSTGP